MKHPPDPQQLVAVCIEAARAAGSHALNHQGRRGEISEQFDHDVKLVMDIECQHVAEEIIRNHFPNHAILGEEGQQQTNHAIEWIIDPIDGTANYARGLPTWCCSIAARRNHLIEAGCVFVPLLDECYSATIDSPAYCNGEALHASNISTLRDASIFTGLTKDLDPRALHFFTDLAPRVSKLRIAGSAAIDICHVACGRSDGYFEAGLYLWDIAAAGLIAERAGAIKTEWLHDEPYGGRCLCTLPALHEEIKQIAETHFGESLESITSDSNKPQMGHEE